MRHQRLFPVLAASLFATQAFPISKVGNARVGDPVLGFAAPIPERYQFHRETVENGAILSSLRSSFDPRRPGLPIGRIDLSIRDFSWEFPDLAQAPRTEIEEFFQSNDETLYRKLNASDPCVDMYLGRSADLDYLIAVWGSRKGAVFIGESGPQTLRALREIAAGLVLDEGACAWE